MAKKMSPVTRDQSYWLTSFVNPSRIDIIRQLATGSKTVSELAEATDTEMVNVSANMTVLKGTKVVSFEKSGRFVTYSLVGAKAVGGNAVKLTHHSGLTVTIPL